MTKAHDRPRTDSSADFSQRLANPKSIAWEGRPSRWRLHLVTPAAWGAFLLRELHRVGLEAPEAHLESSISNLPAGGWGDVWLVHLRCVLWSDFLVHASRRVRNGSCRSMLVVAGDETTRLRLELLELGAADVVSRLSELSQTPQRIARYLADSPPSYSGVHDDPPRNKR